MNVLLSLCKKSGTQNGNLPDETWMKMVTEYFDKHMDTEFDKIAEFVTSNSKDYTIMFRTTHS